MKIITKVLIRGALAATVALAGVICAEHRAIANETVAGYSGKAFFSSADTCFSSNAGWAQNNCPSNEAWVIYPITSDQLTSTGYVDIQVNPQTPTGCEIDVTVSSFYHYTSGVRTTTASYPNHIIINPIPLAAGTGGASGQHSAQIVCNVPPGGQVLSVFIE